MVGLLRESAAWRWGTRCCAAQPRISLPPASQNDRPVGQRLGRRRNTGAVDLRGVGILRSCALARNKNPVSRGDLTDAYAIKVLIDAHGDDPAFSDRFLADELLRAEIEIVKGCAFPLCLEKIEDNRFPPLSIRAEMAKGLAL